ncbi:MAG: 2-dehydro-3-deoxygalactonokinase [Adhaeribacter sp.]
MNEFLSLDWGTSSFRLRLVDAGSGQVKAEESSGQGIADTFRQWQQSPAREPEERLLFYCRVIADHIPRLEEKLGQNLAGTTVVVSGMASSTIGMQELPYQSLPFATDGSGLATRQLPPSTAFPHPILLISGVKSEKDVMRGEETQLIGVLSEAGQGEHDGIYIFPGTHAKHLEVQANQVVGFHTYMTGEFFELLARHSILSATVTASEGQASQTASFQQGVRDARDSNLLHAAFLVRTNNLFGRYSREENFSYLSGLLIGTELQQLLRQPGRNLYLCGGSRLQAHYQQALEALGLAGHLQAFPASWVDEAVIRGQSRILARTNFQ